MRPFGLVCIGAVQYILYKQDQIWSKAASQGQLATKINYRINSISASCYYLVAATRIVVLSLICYQAQNHVSKV